MGRVPAEIEEIAGQQQPGPPGLLGHRKIPQRRQRQKQQKLCRIENHRYSSSNLFWLPLGGSWLREAQTEGETETICLAAANFFVSPPPASQDCLRNRPLCRYATSPHGAGSYPRRGGHLQRHAAFLPVNFRNRGQPKDAILVGIAFQRQGVALGQGQAVENDRAVEPVPAVIGQVV